MKYLKYALLVAIVLSIFCSSLFVDNHSSAATIPSKLINVVYDDSGSMYEVKRGGSHVDTWGKAKYAMEVFVSMLGTNDTMNIYYMSDYGSGATNPPRLTFNGSSNAQNNVDMIHNEKTVSSNTYFNTIVKAMNDLKSGIADEKYLVILTDGDIEDGKKPVSEIDAFLADKSDNTIVVYLAMGSGVKKLVTNKPEKNIIVYQAATNDQILSRVTDISNRIFMNNKVAVKNQSFDFDIPMKELTVFVQGSNLSYKGLKDGSGNVIADPTKEVKVKGSACDATDQDNEPMTGLNGLILVYQGDYNPGKYEVLVDGAETVEVYYKPNIDVCVDLYDSKGNIVENVDNIEAGDYKLSFGFVKAGTNERVNKDSSLLGNVQYNAKFIINGKEYPGAYKDGDKISLEPGDIYIDVTANYLDYNSVETHISYGIFQNKYITFKVVDDKNPEFIVDKEGFTNENPNDYIEVIVNVSGVDMDQSVWDSMTIPEVVVDKPLVFKYVDQPRSIDSIRIEKTNEIGVYRLYPELSGKPGAGLYSNTKYTLNYNQSVGIDTWLGSMEDTVKVNDIRPWWDRNWDLFIKLLITLIILIIIAGYLPLFKNYLPRGLVSRPFIDVSSIGNKIPNSNGKMEKSMIHTLLPYVSERATIKFVPPSFSGFPKMKVKAIRENRMVITNPNAYINKNVTFGVTSITTRGQEVKLSKNSTIRTTNDSGIDAICYLNTKKR